MSAFIDTFYNSFVSAGPHGHHDDSKYRNNDTVFAEIELLKVMAPRYDLNVFTEELSRLKYNVGINVEISVVIPSRKKQQTMEALEKHEWDFLDYIFSDTIPFLHDFLTYGSPEAQFYQIKGSKKDMDCFNDLCKQMIYNTELQCKLEITDRRRLFGKKYLKNTIFGTNDSEPDILDAVFTDDFSKTSPFLHSMLVA